MMRRYELGDIPRMIEILREDIKTTSYKDCDFDETKLMNVLASNINNSLFFGNLVVEDGELVGAFVATLASPMFTTNVIAYDTLFYVSPEKRSFATATALVESYIAWAKERKVMKITLSNSMGRNVEEFEKLARLYGFTKVGSVHHMELN